MATKATQRSEHAELLPGFAGAHAGFYRFFDLAFGIGLGQRGVNHLAIEEKKDGKVFDGIPSGELLKEPAERALEAAIAKVKFDTKAAIDVENFEGAMRALAELRGPVDKFFDDVKVNDDDSATRENRLKLLSEIRAATLTVADFSKIAG